MHHKISELKEEIEDEIEDLRILKKNQNSVFSLESLQREAQNLDCDRMKSMS